MESRPGQGEADYRVALERRGRGFRRDRRVRGDVPDDPGMRGGARVGACQAHVVHQGFGIAFGARQLHMQGNHAFHSALLGVGDE